MSAGPRAAPEAERRAPLALKAIHAAVFLSFSGLSVAAAWPELLQLRFGLAGPWHSGTPPSWPAVLGCAASFGAGLFVAVRLVSRREVTLYVSGAVLLGFAAALTASGHAAERRSVGGGNLYLLELARALRAQMGGRLQALAAVPDAPAEWDAALEGLAEKAPGGSPLRDRAFRRVQPRALLVEDPGWSGEGEAPGTIGVWISADRVEFALLPVGLSPQGRAQPLLDDRGGRIRLKGVFNPDIPQGAP